MKKTLLLTFTLLATMATALRAQSFQFQFQGRTLAEGDTVTIVAEEDIFGEMACETNPADNPTNGLIMQKLTSATPNVTAILEITDNALTCSQLQWCMGGACETFRGTTKLTKQFQPSATEQVQFDAYGIEGDGFLIAKLTVKAGLESPTIYIRFLSGAYDDIHDVKASDHTSSAFGKGKIFTIDGKLRTAPRKGINIIGGKKVLVK